MGTVARTSFRPDRLLKKGAAALFLLSAPLIASERFELERKDGSELTGYVDTPAEKPFSLVLLLQSSQKESSRRLHDSLKELFLENHYAVVSLEKRGIDGKKTDEKEYNRFNSPSNRLEDALLLLGSKAVAGWNGKAVVIGQGEGGKIGSALAAKLPEKISALILVSAGGGWPASEELLTSFRSEMAGNGFSPQYIHSFLVQSREQFEGASKKPSHEHNLFGFSYLYWDGLKQLDLLSALSSLKCPVYYVHGDKDDRIPSESVDFLAEALKEKKNFTMKRIAGSGREVIQDMDTYSNAATWLKGL